MTTHDNNSTTPTDAEMMTARKERIAEWLAIGIDADRLAVLTAMFDHLLARIENLESATDTPVPLPLRRPREYT